MDFGKFSVSQLALNDIEALPMDPSWSRSPIPAAGDMEQLDLSRTSVQLQLIHVLLDPVLHGVGTDFPALPGDKPVG